jgi:hypothetical protein
MQGKRGGAIWAYCETWGKFAIAAATAIYMYEDEYDAESLGVVALSVAFPSRDALAF